MQRTGDPREGRPGSTVSEQTLAQKGATHASHGQPEKDAPARR